MSKVDELEKQLQDRRDARAKLEVEQYEKDLQARLDAEDEHGTVAAIKVARYLPGQPTCAYVRTPQPAEYKRFKQQIMRAGEDKGKAKRTEDAIDLLAKACWIYPVEEEDRDAMLDAFPGLLTPISAAAAALAEGKSEDEGKG